MTSRLLLLLAADFTLSGLFLLLCSSLKLGKIRRGIASYSPIDHCKSFELVTKIFDVSAMRSRISSVTSYTVCSKKTVEHISRSLCVCAIIDICERKESSYPSTRSFLLSCFFLLSNMSIPLSLSLSLSHIALYLCLCVCLSLSVSIPQTILPPLRLYSPMQANSRQKKKVE